MMACQQDRHWSTWVVFLFVALYMVGCTATMPTSSPPLKSSYDAMLGYRRLPAKGAALKVERRLSAGVSRTETAKGFGLRMSHRISVAYQAGKRREVQVVNPAYRVNRMGTKQMVDMGRRVPPRINVQAIRRPAQAFFTSLVSADPTINMIVHPDVSGEITLELKRVTVDEVVQITCEMYHFDCQPLIDKRSQGGMRGYKIFPWQLTTRTYRVDFLPVVRSGYSETVVISSNKKDSISINSSKNKNSSITNSTNAGSKIRTAYESNFWDDLEQTLRSIVKLDLSVSSVKEHTNFMGLVDTTVRRERDKTSASAVTPTLPGTSMSAVDVKSIMVNRQAGLVTVRTYPQEHQEIVTFLQQLRIRSQRQVILEAKVLEVELNDGFQFGIDWLAVNKGLGSGRFPPLSSEPSGGTTFTGSMPYRNEVQSDFLTPFTQGVVLSQQSVQNPVSLAFREHDFVGYIHLLQQQGKVQVLSSPRIATINNQKAVIKVGQDEFFITGLDSGSVVGSGDSSQQIRDPTAIFTSMFTGVSLDVTPQVGEGDMITLHIHPMVTSVQDVEKHFTINGKVQQLPLAQSQTRETDSIVRVANGEVAVIGGLMKSEEVESKSRLPLLGDLPLLGSMFGTTEKNWKKSELVILVRPILVDGRQDWKHRVGESADRIVGMENQPPLWWTQ